MTPVIFLFDSRIGHLAFNTEILFRRLNESKENPIIISSYNPANKQLLNMFRRVRKIYRFPKLNSWVNYLVKQFPKIFSKAGYNYIEYHEMNELPRTLEFTEHEKIKGKKALYDMGIDSWYVCVNARESNYLKQKYNNNGHGHDFRDSNINSYLKAMDYITEQGGYVIRMGQYVENKMDTDNPKIIDYAHKYRSDFMDIFLCANCRFYLGDSAGLFAVASIFDRPVCIVNMIPINYPMRKGDLVLFKKIWSNKLHRMLTFEEMKDERLWYNSYYVENKLDVVDNTADEILKQTKNMLRSN